MAPYRTTDRDETAEAPRDQGIVGDVIAQFADPLAFYRELVQNSIDAGSPRVDISLAYEDGHLRVRVADRGCGMTRDILENQLLVLFRSTKETDPTKIGKFSIGFTSVLAPNPALVVVTTVRDGKRLTLHLRPDLTYQLFDGGAATRPGTVVELELRIPAEAAGDFATRSYQALVRWCRHAQVELQFSADVPGLAEASATPGSIAGRIDRPLSLDDALLEVRAVSPDGKLMAVAGIERVPRSYTGFFNHGLTLFETTAQLVGTGISVKLQDARLGHTLSRDNVRRDRHFDAAIAFARELVETALPNAASRELCASAEAGDLSRYGELMRALASTDVKLTRAQTWVPLAVAIASPGSAEARRAARLSDIPGSLWAVSRPNRLAAAFAAANIPIALLEPRLALQLGAEALEDAFVHVQPVELTDHDHALVGELAQIFEDCRRAPKEIVIAELEGAHATSLAIGGGRDDARLAGTDAYVLAREEASKPPLGKFVRGTLVLSAHHALMEAARRATDPRIAASHLARVLLLGYGLLDTKRSERILARGLAALGLGAMK